MKPTHALLAGIVLGCIQGLPPQACGQQEATTTDTFDPKAAALLDKYVEVTGGEAAYRAVKSRLIQGELAGQARAVAGTIETCFAPGGLFYSQINTPAGVHRRGCNGNTVWKIEPQYDQTQADLQNLKPTYVGRVLAGLERVLVLRDGTLDRFGHWRELAQKVEYAGQAEIGAQTCDKVVLTYRPLDPEAQEEPITLYLDQATGLIARYDTAISRTDPEQFVRVSADLDNYRKVDDVLLPHKMTVKTNDVEQYTVRIITVQNNVAIPAQRFVLPPEIQKLLVSGKQ